MKQIVIKDGNSLADWEAAKAEIETAIESGEEDINVVAKIPVPVQSIVINIFIPPID